MITTIAFRLPTSIEWAFAARGGNKNKRFPYAGSDDLDEIAWYANNSTNRTRPVAKKKPNELGLYDMSGNVSEWCFDDKKAKFLKVDVDPIGSTTSKMRVYRGGAWVDKLVSHLQVNTAKTLLKHNRQNVLGFRLAATVNE